MKKGLLQYNSKKLMKINVYKTDFFLDLTIYIKTTWMNK